MQNVKGRKKKLIPVFVVENLERSSDEALTID
jgi:hypothetical protein